MDLEGLAAEIGAFDQAILDVGVASGGNQRREPVEAEIISLDTSPALMRPGQRIIAGTRNAPSQLVSFSLRNGVVAASGHDHWFGPLSVE